ncbi:MAG: hypothetical protein WDO19_25855 [Bacteroidota bacterium]
MQQANYFLPWKKYVATEQWVKDAATDWNNRSWQCYAQLADHVDMDKETGKIALRISIFTCHQLKKLGEVLPI